MKTHHYTIIFVAMLMLQSCSYYYATYHTRLMTVEFPVDDTQEYSPSMVTHIESDKEDNLYKDKNIAISWRVTNTGLAFTLTNVSDHNSIRINWEDICYIDIYGNVNRVMHSGVKYADKNAIQPSTIIPRGATIYDELVPTNNVSYIDKVGWVESGLFPQAYNYLDEFKEIQKNYIYKTIKIFFPLIIKGIQNDYVFEFLIVDIMEDKIYYEYHTNDQLGDF